MHEITNVLYKSFFKGINVDFKFSSRYITYLGTTPHIRRECSPPFAGIAGL